MGSVIRVEGRTYIFDQSKQRALGVVMQKVAGGLLKPTALVGVDPRRGTVSWTKEVPLQLFRVEVPWSFEVARNITIVAAWVEGNKVRAFDIYGRDAWEAKLPGTLGVAKIGEGFVTAWGSKVYFLDRATGKHTEVADVGAPITAPLTVLPEGEILAMTGDFLIGVNLDKPGTDKVFFRHRLTMPEGLQPLKPQWAGDTIVVGAQAIPMVIKTEVTRLDPGTLKPRWRTLLPGRVRSHDALAFVGEEIRVINRVPGSVDHQYVLRGADGQVTGKLKPEKRRGCQHGATQFYCITPKAMTAYDNKSLRQAWQRELLDDYTTSQHLVEGKTVYVAEGGKVVGIDESGRVTFSFELKSPPFRPQVNRILGIVKGTMVVTVVDWVTRNGMGQIWGIDMAKGVRKWMKPLPAPAYTEKAVQLVDERVIYADGTTVNVLAAGSGGLTGTAMHQLKGPATKVPTLVLNGGKVWIERENPPAVPAARPGARAPAPRPAAPGVTERHLAFVSLEKVTKILWRMPITDLRVVTVTESLLFLKTAEGEIQAIDLKTGKQRWKLAYQPTLTPKIVEVPGSVLVSHADKLLVLDAVTGTTKDTMTPGGWHLALLGDTPVVVRVLTFTPEAAGSLEAVRYDRETKKISPAWALKIPKDPKPAQPVADAVPGVFPWYHVDSDLVMRPLDGGRCLVALDLTEGKQRWKQCDLPVVAPPRAYQGILYLATGPVREGAAAEKQGLFAIDTDSGSYKQLFKVPKSGDERFMHPQLGPIWNGEYFVLVQGDRLRHILVAPPPKSAK
jgi:outer membrane protein assembly factor BamB